MKVRPNLIFIAAVLWCAPCAAIDMPEPLDLVCAASTLPDDGSIKRCMNIYSAAAAGSGEHMTQIGIHIQQLSLPSNGSGDMLSVSELSRQIETMGRAVRWFRLARELNYGEASYWLAKTLNAAFTTALLPAHLPELAGRSGILLPKSLGLGSPNEAVNSAYECAHKNDARCMVLPADFMESSYGFSGTTNRLNAAEWLVKAAFRWTEVGAREQSLSIFERLTRDYPDYPYLCVLREHLFPIPKPPLPRQNKPAPEGNA
jgi:hypothetical protein